MASSSTVATCFFFCHKSPSNARIQIVVRSGFMGFEFIAYTGSVVMVCFPTKLFCCSTTSTKAIANRRVSSGVFFGSVHSLSCTDVFRMFCMKMSWIRLSIWFPKSHFTANPVKQFRNRLSGFLFALSASEEFKSFQFSVLLFLFLYNFWSLSVVPPSVVISMCGYISDWLFRPAVPSDRNKKLITFLFVTASF